MRGYAVLDIQGNELENVKITNAQDLYSIVRDVKGYHETVMKIAISFESHEYIISSFNGKLLMICKNKN